MKTGDIVTLNQKGIDFMSAGRFPAIIGSMYTNIHQGGGKILRIEGQIARVKILNGGYPADLDIVNDFGICKRHLEIVR